MRIIPFLLLLVGLSGCWIVSEKVHEKFIFIDQQLKHQADSLLLADSLLINQMIKNAVLVGSANAALADSVHAIASETIAFLKDYKIKIGEACISESAKSYKCINDYTFGPAKNGQILEAKLDEFVNRLNAMHPDFKIESLTLDANEIEQFKNDPDQQNKSFLALNFERVPFVAAQAVLSQFMLEVAQAEQKALKVLAEPQTK